MKLLTLPFRFLAWVFEPLRAPTFDEAYWHEVAELVPYMDAADRRWVLETAERANVGRELLGRMRYAPCVDADDPRRVTLEQLNNLAKRRAPSYKGPGFFERTFSLRWRVVALLLVIAAVSFVVVAIVGFANGTLP